jgi:hypothetical protein
MRNFILSLSLVSLLALHSRSVRAGRNRLPLQALALRRLPLRTHPSLPRSRK